METDPGMWVPAESRAALASMLVNNGAAAAELVTADPNTWGYFQFSNGKKLVLGYANLGLRPAVATMGSKLIVGIDELLAGFDRSTLEQIFTYRMPTVFHEFVSISGPIIVRDEVGFVGLSAFGKEHWRHMTTGPIQEFTMAGGWLRGQTIDGERFAFLIPA